MHEVYPASVALPASVAQWGELRIATPTGTVRAQVRAAPRARYLLPAGMACGQWQWSHYRPDEVIERGSG